METMKEIILGKIGRFELIINTIKSPKLLFSFKYVHEKFIRRCIINTSLIMYSYTYIL